LEEDNREILDALSKIQASQRRLGQCWDDNSNVLWLLFGPDTKQNASEKISKFIKGANHLYVVDPHFFRLPKDDEENYLQEMIESFGEYNGNKLIWVIANLLKIKPDLKKVANKFRSHYKKTEK
jgi:hypothetical protein